MMSYCNFHSSLYLSKILILQCLSYDFRHRLTTMIVKPFTDTLRNLDCDGRIDEVGCSNLNGTGSSKEELDGILSIHNASKTYDRNIDCLSHLIDTTNGYRLNCRTRHASGTDA